MRLPLREHKRLGWFRILPRLYFFTDPLDLRLFRRS
jgi:hypothetical protein